MRIAITGASGFCGSAVARAAAANATQRDKARQNVVCLGRRPGPVGEHRFWDATTEPPDLDGIDAIIHLAAAVGDPHPAEEPQFRAVNVDGTRRLLDAAGERPVVWVSSASVYRPGPYPEPVREDHPTDNQSNAYGRTKAAGERLARQAGKVVLRPRAVYGPGDPHLLPRLRRVVFRNTAWLPGPDVQLSLTAVENLADACWAAATRQWPAGAYNIADRTAYSRDAAVAAVLGVPVRHVPLAAAAAAVKLGFLTQYALDQVTDGLVLDIAKAQGHGWSPKFSLSPSGSSARS